MKKFLALLMALSMIFALCVCAPSASAEDAEKSIGFVTFGLGGDFFQALADTFVSTMEANGWKASYVDGEFNPTAQIAAMENYIAQGVDEIVLWSVAPEAMGSVIEQAQSAGIKVIAFVAPTEKYDAMMLAEDAKTADGVNKLAAKWIDETFADAEDHSVPVAVFSCRTAETGVVQADELIKIEDFSAKAKFVKEVELQGELEETGLSAAENLYTTDPEIKVFLTAHNGLALGINNYFTGLSSPVTDYSDMGIFCVNGDDTIAGLIKDSADGKTPFRGMVLTGSVADTAGEILMVAQGIYDGSLPIGHIQNATLLFVNGDTAPEYLESGKVTTLSEADLTK